MLRLIPNEMSQLSGEKTIKRSIWIVRTYKPSVKKKLGTFKIQRSTSNKINRKVCMAVKAMVTSELLVFSQQWVALHSDAADHRWEDYYSKEWPATCTRIYYIKWHSKLSVRAHTTPTPKWKLKLIRSQRNWSELSENFLRHTKLFWIMNFNNQQ